MCSRCLCDAGRGLKGSLNEEALMRDMLPRPGAIIDIKHQRGVAFEVTPANITFYPLEVWEVSGSWILAKYKQPRKWVSHHTRSRDHDILVLVMIGVHCTCRLYTNMSLKWILFRWFHCQMRSAVWTHSKWRISTRSVQRWGGGPLIHENEESLE